MAPNAFRQEHGGAPYPAAGLKLAGDGAGEKTPQAESPARSEKAFESRLMELAREGKIDGAIVDGNLELPAQEAAKKALAGLPGRFLAATGELGAHRGFAEYFSRDGENIREIKRGLDNCGPLMASYSRAYQLAGGFQGRAGADFALLLPYAQAARGADGAAVRETVPGKAVLVVNANTGRRDSLGRQGLAWTFVLAGEKSALETIFGELATRGDAARFIEETIPLFGELEPASASGTGAWLREGTPFSRRDELQEGRCKH
jgi:hypothetical protein